MPPEYALKLPASADFLLVFAGVDFDQALPVFSFDWTFPILNILLASTLC